MVEEIFGFSWIISGPNGRQHLGLDAEPTPQSGRRCRQPGTNGAPATADTTLHVLRHEVEGYGDTHQIERAGNLRETSRPGG